MALAGVVAGADLTDRLDRLEKLIKDRLTAEGRGVPGAHEERAGLAAVCAGPAPL